MIINAMVVQDRPEKWFQGTRDERDVRILTCMDPDTHLGQSVANSFDYRPTPEEQKHYPAGMLIGRIVKLSIRSIVPSKGGRLVMSGLIDAASVAKNTAAPK
jgi:hypothetical protein